MANTAASGSTSKVKGDAFQKEVSELYQLLGAHVTENVQICNKKVDLFASFPVPGGTGKHRVIVECKDEKTRQAQNQRVMQFQGLLDTARRAGEAESAEIVTRVAWGDAAKGYARTAGIHLTTYAEKLSLLIEFSAYLSDLVDGFSTRDMQRPGEPPLASYYVEPQFRRITLGGSEPVDLTMLLKEWLAKKASYSHIAILSGYGTGKTSFCQKLAWELAKDLLSERKTSGARIPILFDLREFTKTVKIEALVSSFLDEKCGVQNPRFRLFQKMNDAGFFFLIFDGFDEMAARVDADTLEANIVEIEKLATSPSSKVLITSRGEYFVSSAEERRLFRPRGIREQSLITRATEYQGFTIALWDQKRIDQFLRSRMRLPLDAKRPWTYYKERLNKIPGLKDLARRPVLLEMIVKTLPDLVESVEAIDRPNIYNLYLQGEIRRQKVQKKRTLLLTESNRFRVLEQLALDFYNRDVPAIGFSEAQARVRELGVPNSELEAYVRDFLTCSFLVRQGDAYRFSHRSIMEYLAALALWRQLQQKNTSGWREQRLTEGVAEFIAELHPDVETLREWIRLTRAKDDARYLGGNAATIICRLNRNALRGQDMSNVNLRGADLRLTNLTGVRFNGAILQDVRLEGARFAKRQFEKAERFIDLSISVSVILNKITRGTAEFAIKEVGRTLAFSGVVVESAEAIELKHEQAVGCLRLRVADSERWKWIEQKLGGQRQVAFRAIYAEETDLMARQYGKASMQALKVLQG